VADDQLGPEEAVRAYHGALGQLRIRPHRSLADDLQRTDTASSYSGEVSTVARPRPTAAASTSKRNADEPDFAKMTQAEKVQWNLERWKRIIG
jgi:hypothetical protein